MARVTGVTVRDNKECHGDARGRDTPSPPKGALGGVTTTLTEIADRLERLSPSHRDPEKFFEERSELAFALLRIADDLRGPSAQAGLRVRCPAKSLDFRRGGS